MKVIFRYLAVFSVFTCLLFSCHVGKKYSRTDLSIPGTFRNHIAMTSDSVVLPWRMFFKDTALIVLIEKALQKNNEIAVAAISIRQLDLTYRQANKGLLPSLNFNVGATRNWFSSNSLNGSLSKEFLGTGYIDDYNTNFALSWEADIWGKVKMQKEGALANYLAQKQNASALKTRIIVQVAQAYFNLGALDEQLRVARRNVELGDSTVNMLSLQYKSGQINSLAVEQAQGQKKTAELLILLALQNIAVQENALSILCGEYPDKILRLPRRAKVLTGEPFEAGVPARLLSRRPDVKAAEYAVVAANSRTGLAKAAMYPTINLSPSIGANSFQFNTWFDLPGSLIKNVGINLTQPIFQKGRLKMSYDVAALEQEKAVSIFKQSVLTAVGEVSDALARSKYADERLLLVEQKYASLTKARADASLLYKSGKATYLEVITAQNNALQNELEAISITRDKQNAVTDLYRALGGGVEN